MIRDSDVYDIYRTMSVALSFSLLLTTSSSCSCVQFSIESAPPDDSQREKKKECEIQRRKPKTQNYQSSASAHYDHCSTPIIIITIIISTAEAAASIFDSNKITQFLFKWLSFPFPYPSSPHHWHQIDTCTHYFDLQFIRSHMFTNWMFFSLSYCWLLRFASSSSKLWKRANTDIFGSAPTAKRFEILHFYQALCVDGY